MVEAEPQKLRRHGAAAAFIDVRLRQGRVAFALNELVSSTGLSVQAAKEQLRRLKPRVVRATPGEPFFLVVSPEHQAMGAPPVEWWIDDYFTWLCHPYYLGLLSAAAVHGSSPQAIQVVQVMSDAPRKSVRLGRKRIDFFVKRRLAQTPTQQLPAAFAPTRVSTPAATVFDLVRYAPRIGGVGRAAETLRPLLHNIHGAELKQVLEAEDETATAQRLGYLLERAGAARLADQVARWLTGRRLPRTPLVPAAGPVTGPLVERWRIVDNSGEFAA